MFYSQFGEDRLLAEVFHGRSTGLCVEVGANDGINDSTTYHFEREGWNCVLVEANPDLCGAIREVRSAQLFECAASSANGTATFYIAEGPGRAHGVSGMDGGTAAAERIAQYGFGARPIAVRTRTLDDVLEEAGVVCSPDFVSIDVEGYELEVLKGFSLDRWRPTIVLAEDNSAYEDGTVSRYMRRFGYIPFKRTGVNDWYAHHSSRHLVTVRNRASWHLTGLGMLARNRLRKVPGLRAVRDFLVGR